MSKDNAKKFELPHVEGVDYTGHDKGQIRLAGQSEIKFEWQPTNSAINAWQAVERFRAHCQKLIDELIDEHLANQQAELPSRKGLDYSLIQGGKHYWILASNKMGLAKWFVAKYLPGDGGYWVSLEDNEQIKLPRVFKIGDHVPHPVDAK